MTPYEIDVLLWYYKRGEDHPDMERDPPVWRPTIHAFLDEDLLTFHGISPSRPSVTCYTLTPRGHAYCEALQRVPLPYSRWIVDWPSGDVQLPPNRILKQGEPSTR